MRKYTRSALRTQEGVDKIAMSEQEIFRLAYAEGIAFRKAKASLRNSPLPLRKHLARIVIQARESENIPQHAANVFLSLLGVKGGVL